MSAEPGLSVQVRKLTAYALVTATGSIGPSTHPLLTRHLTQALEMTRAAVIVDMSAVDHCDVSGSSAIAHAIRRAGPYGPTFVVVAPPDRLKRVLAVTGPEAVYAHPDLDSAVRWLENGTHR